MRTNAFLISPFVRCSALWHSCLCSICIEASKLNYVLYLNCFYYTITSSIISWLSTLHAHSAIIIILCALHSLRSLFAFWKIFRCGCRRMSALVALGGLILSMLWHCCWWLLWNFTCLLCISMRSLGGIIQVNKIYWTTWPPIIHMSMAATEKWRHSSMKVMTMRCVENQ